MAMTRETKIGLLVGLAFIILFGIILSEKGSGRDQLTTTPIAAREPIIELVPPAESQPVTLHAAQTTPPQQPVGTGRKLTPARTPAKPASPVRDMMPPKPKSAIVKRIPASKATVAMNQSPDRPDPDRRIDITVPQKPTLTPTLAQHHVEPGQTLAGICHLYYPGRAYNMVKTVMRANNITVPQKLRAGQTLIMPVDDNTARQVALTNQAANHNPLVYKVLTADTVAERTQQPPRPPGRYYTVQHKDTLSRIAKRFYGRQAAWHWLYKRNHDLINNPHVLRAGLKIRLPDLDNVLAVGPARPD